MITLSQFLVSFYLTSQFSEINYSFRSSGDRIYFLAHGSQRICSFQQVQQFCFLKCTSIELCHRATWVMTLLYFIDIFRDTVQEI